MTSDSNPTFAARLQKNWRLGVGITLTLLTLIWLIITTDWSAAWQALIGTNYAVVFGALLVNLATIPLRSLRWRLLFSPNNRPPLVQLTAAMLIGQTVNLLAPARLGDLVRASLIKNHPTAFVLGTQVVQSALDLLMLALLVLLMLFQVSLPDWWRGSGEALLWTAMFVLLSLLILLLFRRQLAGFLQKISRRWNRLRGIRYMQMGVDFLQSLDVFSRPILFLGALTLSLIIWLVYGATNFILLRAITPQGTFLIALFVLIVLQLGVAVPSSPGRVGVFHYLSAQALLVFAIDEGPAISFAILLHLISIIFPAILGMMLAWRLGVDWSPAVEKKPHTF